MKNIRTRAYNYLNTVNPEECDVVTAVKGEANNVQREEIKVETNYTEGGRSGVVWRERERESNQCLYHLKTDLLLKW